MHKKRVLVGSPVYQKPEILEPFLASLKRLTANSISLDYMFVDDNIDEKSSRMLAGFKRENSEAAVIPGQEQGAYLCTDESHKWNDSLMLKVANYKNAIIQYAKDKNYDYL
ncbi:MAG: glycosyl transferase, partial [Clostridiales bacterium]|nr:glycosyl transferase [Clostridiales bacterium]